MNPMPELSTAPGVGAVIVFAFITLLTIGGAIFTITARNTISAVMSLVACFFGVASLYALLNAHFLAAVQVLVYAGAIMTLFVFVVMVLNREEAERWGYRSVVTKVVGSAALTYVVVAASVYVFGGIPTNSESPPPGWGGVADVGRKLFTDYLFVFEAVSLPLLIAVIGAVVVARTPKHTHEEESNVG